jgi:hypothetical protein
LEATLGQELPFIRSSRFSIGPFWSSTSLNRSNNARFAKSLKMNMCNILGYWLPFPFLAWNGLESAWTL